MTVALAAVAVGCGDEGSSSEQEETAQAGSLSRSQFIARADAICEEARERFESRFRSLVTQAEAGESIRGDIPRQREEENQTNLVETVLVPTYADQTERIGALGAPAGDEEKVASFLRATQANLDEASAEPAEYLARSGLKFTEATRLASAYGMAVCASAMDLSQGVAIR